MAAGCDVSTRSFSSSSASHRPLSRSLMRSASSKSTWVQRDPDSSALGATPAAFLSRDEDKKDKQSATMHDKTHLHHLYGAKETDQDSPSFLLEKNAQCEILLDEEDSANWDPSNVPPLKHSSGDKDNGGDGASKFPERSCLYVLEDALSDITYDNSSSADKDEVSSSSFSILRKPFLRSCSLASREQNSSPGKFLARSASNLSAKDHQEVILLGTQENRTSSYRSFFSFGKSDSKPSHNNWEQQQPLSSDPSVNPNLGPISGLSNWARRFRNSTARVQSSTDADLLASSLSPNKLRFGKGGSPAKAAASKESDLSISSVSQDTSSLKVFTKGFLDSSRNAVKSVQSKARNLVSQNKHWYQDNGLELDMAYITENIVAMGVPSADMNSGLFSFVEGFHHMHHNYMEDAIKYFETQHSGNYKVYNLCSEQLRDASILEGKGEWFPMDENNCPPLQLVTTFCQSAYKYLKAGLENVVVVHCKGGMAHAGLMISCLLLYLKFFPTAEESVNHYNQKRSVDGKGLILPSQLRYVKYFERVLREFDGHTPTGRRCQLRSIQLINCPSWIRPALNISNHNGIVFSSREHCQTRAMLTEDQWLSARTDRVVVFDLLEEQCITEIDGDFKIHFTDRHGNFYCWLNTNMMESQLILNAEELDGFEKGMANQTADSYWEKDESAPKVKIMVQNISFLTGAQYVQRQLPSVGFQVQVEIMDDNLPIPGDLDADSGYKSDDNNRAVAPEVRSQASGSSPSGSNAATVGGEPDDIFTDSEGEEDESPQLDSGEAEVKSRMDLGLEVGTACVDTSRAPDLIGGKNQGKFQNVITNAMSDMGNGILNAVDRIRISHLSVSGRLTSLPNSPRMIHGDRQDFGSSRSTGDNVANCEWLYGSSRSLSGRFLAANSFKDQTVKTTGKLEQLGIINVDQTGNGGDFSDHLCSRFKETPTSSFHSEDNGSVNYVDPPSDFQALAVASAADASVFSFVDDDDYESEDEVTVVST